MSQSLTLVALQNNKNGLKRQRIPVLFRQSLFRGILETSNAASPCLPHCRYFPLFCVNFYCILYSSCFIVARAAGWAGNANEWKFWSIAHYIRLRISGTSKPKQTAFHVVDYL